MQSRILWSVVSEYFASFFWFLLQFHIDLIGGILY